MVKGQGPAPEGVCTCCAGAGLSSSSAFVCVAALALLAAFGAGPQRKTVGPALSSHTLTQRCVSMPAVNTVVDHYWLVHRAVQPVC